MQLCSGADGVIISEVKYFKRATFIIYGSSCSGKKTDVIIHSDYPVCTCNGIYHRIPVSCIAFKIEISLKYSKVKVLLLLSFLIVCEDHAILPVNYFYV